MLEQSALVPVAGSGLQLPALLLLVPFILIFLHAGWIELRRWYRHGPSHNQRALFPFDTAAPGFSSARQGAAARPDAGGRLLPPARTPM